LHSLDRFRRRRLLLSSRRRPAFRLFQKRATFIDPAALQTRRVRFTCPPFPKRPLLKHNQKRDKQMRIGIYARVSTSDQTCEQQLRDLREYVSVRGWVIEAQYVDDGHSGAKSTRPAMNRIMTAARTRKIDGIVVWKIDRWGRSMSHFVNSVQELQSLGVRFIAMTQNIDTDESNPTSRLMLNLLVAFSEFERELIIERTRAGLARARRDGKRLGRPRLVIDRERLAALHQDGWTVRAIAAEVATSPATVCRLLKSRCPPEAAPQR
jgi:DNA invertase Pin-like site-specific DNA recombinase